MTKCSEKMEASKHRVGVLVGSLYDGSHCGGIKWGHFCVHKLQQKMKTIAEPSRIKSVGPINFTEPFMPCF
jgi:hypothetical protein